MKLRLSTDSLELEKLEGFLLYELKSKHLVSPLISPIKVPYITPFKEFRLQLS